MDPSPAPTGSVDAHDAWPWWALLVVLVGLAALLRETGLGFQLPTSVLVDERVYIEQIEAFGSGAENAAELPRAGFYPHLVSRLAYATWRPRASDATDIAARLECASALHLHVRRIVAWISLLAIPGTWLLVRAFASRATALVAAALCATSLFAQLYGQEGRPHAAFLGTLPLALALAVHLQRRPGVARALAAGAAAALALATLQSALFLLAPIAVALALARDIGWRRRALLFACATLPCVLVFVWAYPFLFVDHVDAAVQLGHNLLGEAHGVLRLLTGRGFGVLADALWSYEPAGFVALVFGIPLAAWAGLRGWCARRSGAAEGTSAATVAAGARAPNAIRAIPRAWSPSSWSDSARRGCGRGVLAAVRARVWPLPGDGSALRAAARAVRRGLGRAHADAQRDADAGLDGVDAGAVRGHRASRTRGAVRARARPTRHAGGDCALDRARASRVRATGLVPRR